MISDQTTTQSFGRSPAALCTVHFSLGRDWVAILSILARRATGVAASFAKLPLLPYATMWEASVVARLINAADRVAADSLAPRTSKYTDDGFDWRL